MGEGSKAGGAAPTTIVQKGRVTPRFGVDVPMNIHEMSSDEALPILCDIYKGRALVSFSAGKDAVGCVLALRKAGFTDLHLYHMYIVPGLRIMEEGLAYYEALWDTRITRVQGRGIMTRLGFYAYQPFHRIPLIHRWEPTEPPSFDSISREVRRDLGWGKSVPTVVGIRMDDSIFRAASLKKSGVYQRTRNVLYPVFDWSRERLRQALIETQTRLLTDYRIFGRSFSGDGLDYRFLAPLRKHYPDDYARVLRLFPAIEAELLRYEFSFKAQERAMRQASTFTL
jgi:hypothetical protein